MFSAQRWGISAVSESRGGSNRPILRKREDIMRSRTIKKKPPLKSKKNEEKKKNWIVDVFFFLTSEKFSQLFAKFRAPQ
jgi:hypothetical protein